MRFPQHVFYRGFLVHILPPFIGFSALILLLRPSPLTSLSCLLQPPLPSETAAPLLGPQHRLAQRPPRSLDLAPLRAPRTRQPSWEAGRVDPAERSRETSAGCCPFLASRYPPPQLHPQAFAWENLDEAKHAGDKPPNSSPSSRPD